MNAKMEDENKFIKDMNAKMEDENKYINEKLK